jgi:hypothetical protein
LVANGVKELVNDTLQTWLSAGLGRSQEAQPEVLLRQFHSSTAGKKDLVRHPPQLAPCNREWRTGNSCSDQVNSFYFLALHVPNVGLVGLPLGTIFFQGFVGPMIQLDRALVLKPGRFQAQGLATGSSAQFDRRESE